ncbi:MFS transporter [Streptomyces milbemycinicus]|uniref:MFS transporter n=1 Tax=Streptomyces milbemycinicus TaxID=476552 RepID=UPI0033CDBC52
MSRLDPGSGTENRAQIRRVVLSGWLGSTIEYYDFLLYGTAASLVFDKLFFTNLSPVAGTIASFGTFAVGYLARPLGGAIFGHFGDRLGRKAMLVVSMAMMGIASTLIGLLPTHDQVGNLAPTLLIVLRLIQGVAVGGEWGGAALLTAEHASSRRRGLLTSLVQMGGPAGTVLSTLALMLFSTLPDDEFLSWGWRIPFLLSAALLTIGLFVRLKVTESPLFTEVQQSESVVRRPLVEIFRKPKPLLQACFVVFGATVSQALTSVFAISFAKDVGYGRTEILIGQLVNGVAAAIAIPVSAAWSDRVGRRPVLLGAALTLGAMAFPVFALINTGSLPLMLIALGILAPLPMGSLLGPVPALFSEMFGTSTRYTGVSMGYQLAAVVGGGLAPLIGALLLSANGGDDPWLVALYMLATCLVSATVVWHTAETRGRDLALESAAPPPGESVDHGAKAAVLTAPYEARGEVAGDLDAR